MNQTQLADALGVQKGFVSELVSGKKSPSFETFVALCTALNASPNELFGIWPDVGHSEPQGLSEPPGSHFEAIVDRLMGNQSAPQTDFKLGTDGRLVQVIATVDKAGLQRLITRLKAMEGVLDD